MTNTQEQLNKVEVAKDGVTAANVGVDGEGCINMPCVQKVVARQ